MLVLNDDLLFYFIALLDKKSFLQFSLVCKKFHAMTSKNIFWRPFVIDYIEKNHPTADLSRINWSACQFNLKMMLIQSKYTHALFRQLEKKVQAIEGQIESMCRPKNYERATKDISTLSSICVGLGGGSDYFGDDRGSGYSFKGVRLFFLEKKLRKKEKKRDAIYKDTTRNTIENKLIG